MPVRSICIFSIVIILSFLAFNIGCEDNGTNYENLGPSRLFNPVPDSGAQNQPLDVQLFWGCYDPNGDPLTYEIFFGTEIDPPSVATGHTDTTYNPGILDTNTTYYWKIIASDAVFFRRGPVWSFSTGTE